MHAGTTINELNDDSFQIESQNQRHKLTLNVAILFLITSKLAVLIVFNSNFDLILNDYTICFEWKESGGAS